MPALCVPAPCQIPPIGFSVRSADKVVYFGDWKAVGVVVDWGGVRHEDIPYGAKVELFRNGVGVGDATLKLDADGAWRMFAAQCVSVVLSAGSWLTLLYSPLPPVHASSRPRRGNHGSTGLHTHPLCASHARRRDGAAAVASGAAGERPVQQVRHQPGAGRCEEKEAHECRHPPDWLRLRRVQAARRRCCRADGHAGPRRCRHRCIRRLGPRQWRTGHHVTPWPGARRHSRHSRWQRPWLAATWWCCLWRSWPRAPGWGLGTGTAARTQPASVSACGSSQPCRCVVAGARTGALRSPHALVNCVARPGRCA